MSKARRVIRDNGDSRNEDARDDRVIVTTSRGRRVECMPIATMLDELKAEYDKKIPSPPTHLFSDVAGVSIQIPYTEESIKNAPEEDKDLWEKYLEDKLAVEKEIAERRIRIIATNGINVLDMPPDEEWVADHEWMGFVVPSSPIQRKYHYVKTEVLGTQEDGVEVTAGIYRASGIDKEVLDQIEATFRASRRRPEWKDPGTGSGDPESNEPGKEDGMVEQSELHD